MNYFCAFCGKKNALGYFRYHHRIEYFRLNIQFAIFNFQFRFIRVRDCVIVHNPESINRDAYLNKISTQLSLCSADIIGEISFDYGCSKKV